MRTPRLRVHRFLSLTAALLLAAVTASAQGTRPPAQTLPRQVTTALGLTQADYNAAQQKHRERLGVLSG